MSSLEEDEIPIDFPVYVSVGGANPSPYSQAGDASFRREYGEQTILTLGTLPAKLTRAEQIPASGAPDEEQFVLEKKPSPARSFKQASIAHSVSTHGGSRLKDTPQTNASLPPKATVSQQTLPTAMEEKLEDKYKALVDTQNKRIRRFRILVIILAVLVVAATITAAVSFTAKNNKSEEGDEPSQSGNNLPKLTPRPLSSVPTPIPPTQHPTSVVLISPTTSKSQQPSVRFPSHWPTNTRNPSLSSKSIETEATNHPSTNPSLSLSTFGPSAMPFLSQTIEEIKRRGKVVCGFFEKSGFSTRNQQTGSSSGFEVDLCRAVAAGIFGEDGHFEAVYTDVEDRFEVLRDAKVDLSVASVTRTIERDIHEVRGRS